MSITIEKFREDLAKRKYVLVDYWAAWCKPCKTISPILEKIEKEREDIEIVKINVDDNATMAIEYDIKSIPTLIFFKEGHRIDSLVGAFPENKIVEFIDTCIAKSKND